MLPNKYFVNCNVRTENCHLTVSSNTLYPLLQGVGPGTGPGGPHGGTPIAGPHKMG